MIIEEPTFILWHTVISKVKKSVASPNNIILTSEKIIWWRGPLLYLNFSRFDNIIRTLDVSSKFPSICNKCFETLWLFADAGRTGRWSATPWCAVRSLCSGRWWRQRPAIAEGESRSAKTIPRVPNPPQLTTTCVIFRRKCESRKGLALL